MSDLERFRVAVTVFAETEAVDSTDAGHLVERAVEDALRAALGNEEALVVTQPPRVEPPGRKVWLVQVLETGTAIGNGYLWVTPTVRAWREAGRDER